jgi:hypothetical protein
MAKATKRVNGEPVASVIDAPATGSGFDFEALRLPADYQALVGVKPAHLTIKIRKPDRQEWVRVHPDPDWIFQALTLTSREDRETFLVDRPLQSELAAELRPVALHVAITRAGHVFVWPVPIPGWDGRRNDWHSSALQAAHLARSQWIRVGADMALGAYQVFTTSAALPDPEWPEDLSRELVFERAFRDRLIRTPEHPVLQRLRGEV